MISITWKCPTCGHQTTTSVRDNKDDYDLFFFVHCSRCTRIFGWPYYMHQTGLVFDCGDFSIRVEDSVERGY